MLADLIDLENILDKSELLLCIFEGNEYIFS